MCCIQQILVSPLKRSDNKKLQIEHCMKKVYMYIKIIILGINTLKIVVKKN